MSNYKNLQVYKDDIIELVELSLVDLEDVYEYSSDSEVTKYLEWEPYKNIESLKQFFLDDFLVRYKKDLPIPYAIKYKSKTIGIIDFHTKRDDGLEYGICINKNYWNLGIGTRAVKLMLQFGFEKLDLDAIYSAHKRENISSKRNMEKNHFIYTSYDEKKDLFWYKIDQKTWRKNNDK